MIYKEIAKEKYNIYYTMYNDEKILVGNIQKIFDAIILIQSK